MAAHLEGRAATVLDMSGLAQKFGPVMSHVRIAGSPGELHAVRVGLGAADLVLGCDLVVTTGTEALSKMNDRTTRVVVNATVSPTAEFVKTVVPATLPDMYTACAYSTNWVCAAATCCFATWTSFFAASAFAVASARFDCASATCCSACSALPLSSSSCDSKDVSCAVRLPTWVASASF